MYCNCRSLTPKLNVLRVQAAASSPDIIVLTETWLDPSISSSEIFIPGYTSIHRDRNRCGGGILLYLKDSVPFRNTTCHDSIELVFTELQLKHAPRSFSELESALASIPPASLKSAILLGDFNANLLLPDNQELTSVLSAFHLTQVVDQPTHVTANSSSLIDHVYISDHSSIVVTLRHSVPSFPPLRRWIWKYSQANFKDASNSLRDQLSSSLHPTDVNLSWSSFKEIFLNTMSNCTQQTDYGSKISTMAEQGTYVSISPVWLQTPDFHPGSYICSIPLGTVSSDWKSSIITPVFNAGDPKLATNYRPISLLSIPSKLLERIATAS